MLTGIKLGFELSFSKPSIHTASGFDSRRVCWASTVSPPLVHHSWLWWTMVLTSAGSQAQSPKWASSFISSVWPPPASTACGSALMSPKDNTEFYCTVYLQAMFMPWDSCGNHLQHCSVWNVVSINKCLYLHNPVTLCPSSPLALLTEILLFSHHHKLGRKKKGRRSGTELPGYEYSAWIFMHVLSEGDTNALKTFCCIFQPANLCCI